MRAVFLRGDQSDAGDDDVQNDVKSDADVDADDDTDAKADDKPDAVVETRVAIKTNRETSDRDSKVDFLKEARAMAKLQHENIVRLIGISFENSRDLLILELMEGGDLLKYLRYRQSPIL